MSRGRGARFRARDIDRATIATALDNAYAEGQLTFDEHRARVERARSAVYLGDLDALVGDLQRPVDLPRPTAGPKPAGAGAVGWLVAIVALVLGAGLVWFVARGGDDADDQPQAAAATATTTVVPTEVAPIYAPTVRVDTVDGLREFVDLYRERFGDTIADEGSMHPDGQYIVFDRAEAPNRVRAYTFRGGFDPGALTARDPNTQVIDLSLLNVDAVIGLQNGAPLAVGVPDGKVTHMSLQPNRGVPTISVHVNNEFGESGYLQADFDGRILSVHGR
ncbi:DUF1707 domain-containing protein [Antrihabitans sp. YC2-6]|uniref:DUF1707 SHOCT-like domain-containing protein n=1 Tax=Antrihabitans sp. YC2-6 TaxID=2799498 RepID=UPI0018F55D48|nr:DUF1707 domain-containing protein [Antrihabitans sp. YC2-6]MBJ8347646.1 DUF1707 domain-containing protein [Antrihabitans sp. YC2-6]